MNTETISEQEVVEPKAAGPDWNKLFLPASIFMAAVLISGTLLYVNRDKLSSDNPNGRAQIVPAGEEAKVEVSVDDDPVLGRSDAPVTIVEFSDFQCPFCRKFWSDTLPQIKKEYIDTGKVKLVYRDFPLDFHPMAEPSAQAAECADDQGKFWELHDKIFQEQEKLGQGTIQFTKVDVVKWADQIGLDMTKFNQCMNSGKHKAEVEKDIADGAAAGVSGTPTLFINGKKVVGAQPFASFKAIIDQEL